MKKNLLLTSTLVGLASAMMLFSGCNRPAERPSIEHKDIAGKAFAIADLAEITAEERSVYIKADSDAMLSGADAAVKQLPLEGKAADILGKIKNKATKAALDEHLKTGSVALVVLDDQVKVLKVVPDVELSASYDVFSRAYLGKLKAMSRKPEAKFMAEEKEKLLALKYTAPKDTPDKEKFGMVEITSLKVEKFGTLENDTDDYGQRKHFLVVKERPFEMATHILIGGEVNAAGELLDPPTADELAAQKAAAEKE